MVRGSGRLRSVRERCRRRGTHRRGRVVRLRGRGLRCSLRRGDRRVTGLVVGFIHGGRVLARVGSRVLGMSTLLGNRKTQRKGRRLVLVGGGVSNGVRDSRILGHVRSRFSLVRGGFVGHLRTGRPRLSRGRHVVYTCLGVGLSAGRVTPLLGVSIHKIRAVHCHLHGGFTLRERSDLASCLDGGL